MADTTTNLGNGQQQTLPFMKRPPELRLIMYDLAMRNCLEDIDRTKFLQCGPPETGVSLETENKPRKGRLQAQKRFEGRTVPLSACSSTYQQIGVPGELQYHVSSSKMPWLGAL